ncbi:MAG: hypothetical protein NW226_07750 [Microscillaceae bacterium]|nr:hypothetical protein [Microscillaceae bacterium]
MLVKVFRSLLFILTLLSTSFSYAQDLGNSPYSQVALGDILSPAYSHQAGMGGTGISYSLPFLMNNINPALLARNRRTILDVGVVGQLKAIEQGNASQNDFGASVGHIGLAFPIAPKISGAIGINPFSSVSYENNFRQRVTNTTFGGLPTGEYYADILFRGRGGLTSAFVGFGWDLLGKKNFRPDTLDHRLAVGVKAHYVFGSLIDENITQLLVNSNEFPLEIAFFQRTTFSDITFEPGLAYTYRLGKNTRLHLGAVYSIGKDLSAKRFVSVDQRSNDALIPGRQDTIQDNESGKVTMPSRLGLGISFEKIDPRSAISQWVVSADFNLQDWADFQDFEANTDSLDKNMSMAFGIQYIPDFASVRRGFWRRTAYRVGFNYTQSPLIFEGQRIDDMSVSAGFSVPFGKSSTLLNFSMAAGQRGTLENNLVREKYIKFYLGVTINDTWFIKRKYD